LAVQKVLQKCLAPALALRAQLLPKPSLPPQTPAQTQLPILHLQHQALLLAPLLALQAQLLPKLNLPPQILAPIQLLILRLQRQALRLLEVLRGPLVLPELLALPVRGVL
jgi:hypothetical protein